MDRPKGKSREEEMREKDAKAFLALGKYFFEAKGRRRERGTHVIIDVQPKRLETLLANWMVARLERYDYLYADTLKKIELMKNAKVREDFNKTLKLSDVFEGEMLQFAEFCKAESFDITMTVVVAAIAFTMFESSDLKRLRNRIRPYIPMLKGLKQVVDKRKKRSSSVTNVNELIWGRQKERGLLI